MAALTQKKSKFLCTTLKGEQDVGGCARVYGYTRLYISYSYSW